MSSEMARSARLSLAVQQHDIANMFFDDSSPASSQKRLEELSNQDPCGICGFSPCPLKQVNKLDATTLNCVCGHCFDDHKADTDGEDHCTQCDCEAFRLELTELA